MNLKNEMFEIIEEMDMFTLLDVSNEMKRRGCKITHAEVVKMWEESKVEDTYYKTFIDIELENGFKGSTYVYYDGNEKDVHDVYDERIFGVVSYNEAVKNREEVCEPDDDVFYKRTSSDGRLEIPTQLIKNLGWLPYNSCALKKIRNGFEIFNTSNLSVSESVKGSKYEFIINDKGRIRIPKNVFVQCDYSFDDTEYRIYSSGNKIVVKAI